jgi:hypothetical protein
MYYTIYKITNQVDGKIYIGSHKTKNLDDNYMGSGKYLKRAQEKHGIENFVKEILFVFDNPDDMYAKEAEIVTEDFITTNNTYNMKVGGFGGWDFVNSTGKNLYYDENGNIANGNPQNLHSAKVIKEMLIRQNRWDDYRLNLSEKQKKYQQINGNAFLGKKHTESTKQKISERSKQHQKGSNNSQYGTIWITNGTTNKKIKKDEEMPKGYYKGAVFKRKR